MSEKSKTTETNVSEFFPELGAGVFQQQLGYLISKAALGTHLHGKGKRKAKISIELVFDPIGENGQMMIQHKLSNTIPTNRGKTSEEMTTETVFHMGKGGVLTITPPKEEFSGQFTLSEV